MREGEEGKEEEGEGEEIERDTLPFRTGECAVREMRLIEIS